MDTLQSNNDGGLVTDAIISMYTFSPATCDIVSKFGRHWSHLLPNLNPLLERLTALKHQGLTHGDLVGIYDSVCHPQFAMKISTAGELMSEVDRLSAVWLFSKLGEKK